MAVCLVTGTSSGFGHLIALELARRGDTVVATMRNTAKRDDLDAAAAVEGLSIAVDQLDVTDDASVAACVERVLAEHGRIDVLVNNAGIGRLGPIEEHGDDEILEVFETNVFGPIRVIRSVLPSMRAAGVGVIVNVTSLAAVVAVPFIGVYSASKAAIESFSEALHGELLPFGVRVVTVQPGAYKTPMAIAADQMPRAHTGDSPYSERAAEVRRRHLAAMEAQDDPQDVAAVVASVIHDDTNAVRVIVPATSEGIRGAAATMPVLDFRAMVRGTYGI
ncbi:MAG TPA: SDR family oxidoreductase [Acidimicrobiales bacterium]|nr:SDR family oxidoreductase [Acidimicrobiales bacterium]